MFKLLVPAAGDLVVDGDGQAFRVAECGSLLGCEGCGGPADFILVPAWQSPVPVSSVAYCGMDLAVAVSDPDTSDRLFRAVS